MNDFENYFKHLNQISLSGRIYKRYFLSWIIYYQARKFGRELAEIGCGTGNGILGAFPDKVYGLDINPLAVEYCQSIGLRTGLVEEDGVFPVEDEAFGSCVLDNVLEHIENPQFILSECARVTRKNGGLIIVVPGVNGYACDNDHKKFYDEAELEKLSVDWQLTKLFSIPFIFKSSLLSKMIPQYCLIAVYKKLN